MYTYINIYPHPSSPHSPFHLEAAKELRLRGPASRQQQHRGGLHRAAGLGQALEEVRHGAGRWAPGWEGSYMDRDNHLCIIYHL